MLPTLLVIQAASRPLNPHVLVIHRRRALQTRRRRGKDLPLIATQIDRSGQVLVLSDEMVLDLLAVVQDRLGVLIGLHGPLVSLATQHLLPQRNNEDQKKLDHVAQEEQERVRVRVETQQLRRTQQRPDRGDRHADIHSPHRPDLGGDPGRHPPVETNVLVRDPDGPGMLSCMHTDVADGGVKTS
jgi:hypothetical protein